MYAQPSETRAIDLPSSPPASCDVNNINNRYLNVIKPVWLAVATTLLFTTTALHAETNAAYDIVLLTENFPPHNMAVDGRNFAKDANINGIAVEVVREMFKRAGVSYSLTLRFPWDRIYKLALEKPGYGVFATARLPERETKFKWVGPIGSDHWVLVARGDSPLAVSSLQQAGKLRIGAYKGAAIAAHLEQEGLATITSLRDQENAKKLMAGQIDLWATSDPSGLYLARQEGISDLKTILQFYNTDLYLALNNAVPDEVVEKLQSALNKMQTEGVTQAIRNRYL